MIRRSLRLLRERGRLLFSTNFTRFKLDFAALPELHIEDMTRKSIPKDFERNARIHHCYLIEAR
jgi:23S rRNA (guanine2445-N2)-methyltransferase / 23S rRNA (guanine2069-N7)-methyltransferase